LRSPKFRVALANQIIQHALHLKVSVDTVMRDWKFAKTWLRREVKRENAVPA
jgi:ECF sigma factor